jgi:hypothetical protein
VGHPENAWFLRGQLPEGRNVESEAVADAALGFLDLVVNLGRLEVDEAGGHIREHRFEVQTIRQIGTRACDLGGHREMMPRLARQAKTAQGTI